MNSPCRKKTENKLQLRSPKAEYIRESGLFSFALLLAIVHLGLDKELLKCGRREPDKDSRRI